MEVAFFLNLRAPPTRRLQGVKRKTGLDQCCHQLNHDPKTRTKQQQGELFAQPYHVSIMEEALEK